MTREQREFVRSEIDRIAREKEAAARAEAAAVRAETRATLRGNTTDYSTRRTW